MKSKNWRVVRDVDVFKILVQLAPNVVQWNSIKKQNTKLRDGGIHSAVGMCHHLLVSLMIYLKT